MLVAKKLLLEKHKDLVEMIVRAKISIDKPTEPTVLDIMTDMRALAGIVTVRQTRPVSDPFGVDEKRIIELNVSYIPKFIKQYSGNPNTDLLTVLRSLKTIPSVEMLKVMSHDDDNINNQVIKSPIII